MFEKTLQDLVKGIRNAGNDSAPYIAKATQEIKDELKSRDVTIKAQALQKLIYVRRARASDVCGGLGKLRQAKRR
jgi:AP-3 complex subunit delta